MTFPLLRLELTALTRDRAAWLLFALLFALAALSGANGARFVSAQRAQQEAAIAEQRQADAEARRLALSPDPATLWWENPAHPSGFAYYKMVNYATKPFPPAAALAVGQSDLLPHTLRLNIELRDKFLNTYDYDNPHRLLTGRMDFAFVTIYLLPLFVLALTFNLVSGEREAGILGLIRSHPYPLGRLAALKFSVRAAALALILAAGTFAGLWWGGFDFAGPGAWSALGGVAAIVTVYAAFWFAVAFWFATRSDRPAAVALRYAAVWLVCVILLPAGTNLAVKTARPLPSRVGFIEAKRAANDEAGRARERLVAEYFGDHPEFAAAHGVAIDKLPWNVTRIFILQQLEASIRPIEQAFAAHMAAQQNLLDRLKYLSPAVLAQATLNDLGGSSLARHRAFLAAVDENHAALRDFFNPRILRGDTTFTDFDAWPRFTWVEPPRRVIAVVSPFIVTLGTASLALAAWALRKLREPSVIT
jgi:ABC-2 type transport system permease protein